MAIYSVNMSNIQRSKGENAIKSAAYISGTKLTLKVINQFTSAEIVKTWDFRNKPGVVYSIILAPDGSPDWALDREELWNKAENFEFGDKAQVANRLMVALPCELTQEQNIELAREFALEYLVSHGMVVDLNIHYDNEHNPHMHLQMTTRELITDANGNTRFFPTKNRSWVKKFFVNYMREGVATVINRHLELHGHLDKISNLSHKARGIELTPGIHEGAARHMSMQERRELNERILLKNAAAICKSPELVFQKLSINKPVFSKEDIARVLYDTLYRDMETGSNDTEALNNHYTTEFMVAYDGLLKSPEVRLVNPHDLRGRTLYALTKRLELEERFVATVEELGKGSNHNVGISNVEIDKQSFAEAIGSKVRDIGQMIGLSAAPSSHAFTEEQRSVIVSIVNGNDISLLEGFPGSGKTATVREIVRQYRKAGYRVIGTATSASAAEVLGMETGIESKNISRLRKEWQLAKNSELEFELVLRADYYKEDQYRKFGNALTNKDVLIIDEASMVELSSMDYLLSEVKAAEAKAILVGDNNQLAAIGMTGAFKKASQIVGSSKLNEVMRHKSTDIDVTLKYRQATKLLGQYKVNEALDIYENLSVFNVHRTAEDTKAALVKDYVNGYLELSKHLSKDNLAATKSLVIGAYTNVAVNYFNLSIREHLKAAGVLKGRSHSFRSGNETIELTKGEQIVFLENKPKFMPYYGILNGEVGTVLGFTEHPDRLGRGVFTALVHKANGSKRVVTISTKGDAKHNLFPARFKHGYAVTGYKLQGDTVSHMMVYYESIIGYEAFNVLMTRHRESVKLYASEEVLEDVLYSKIKDKAEEDSFADLRAKYAIEAYKLSHRSGKSNKSKIPAWRIGLSSAVSRRVDNSFSIDYAAKELLSDYEQAIKSYIESRELAFALRSKLEEWKSRVFTPKVLVGLRVQKSDIDPYLLLNPPNNSIWSGLSIHTKEELHSIFEELSQAKDGLKNYAKLICDNYDNAAGNDNANKNRGADITVGDLLTQLGINYETLQRHAGYSNYRYYFKEKEGASSTAYALSSNPHFAPMIKSLETIANNNHDYNSSKDAIDKDKLQIITDIQNNHEALIEYISNTKLALLKFQKELIDLQAKDKAIRDEVDKLSTYTTKLFPEYLSRIYKENPSNVIASWDALVQENGGENSIISSIANRIKSNPKLLGKIKGIGFGVALGITEERQSAIANLEVISKRFKEYETGRKKLAELKDYLASNEYCEARVLLGAKTKEVLTLEQSLPNKSEGKLLNELTDILAISHDSNHSNQNAYTQALYEKLTELTNQDEVQSLIYELHNYEQGSFQSSSISTKDFTSQSPNKNVRSKSTYNARLTYKQVNAHLTPAAYEQIFREFAPQINEDAPKITRTGNWINCGSLGMNLKNGTWNRFSTNESGNIYSFISLASGYSKVEALEFVANKVGLHHEYKNNENKHNFYSQTPDKITTASQEKAASNIWTAYSIVPTNVASMNPKKDFPWVAKEHDIENTYEYRNINGDLMGGTMRLVDKSTKNKRVLPYAYCKNEATNQSSWRFKGFTDHGFKPIYGIEKLNHDKRTILIVEGEKTAHAAQSLFPEYSVMSWLGGSSAVDKVNWSQLKNRTIVIWPDNDEAGKTAAFKILNHLNVANDKVGFASIVDLSAASQNKDQNQNHSQVYNPFPDTWDLADKLPVGITICDIKQTIEEAKNQSQLLERPTENTKKLYYQIRSQGLSVQPQELETRAQLAKSHLETLSALETIEQFKYLEAKGIISQAHEFLKPEHGIYRDTLVCLMQQIVKVQADETIDRKFITNIQSKYDELIKDYSLTGISYLEHYDSIHQIHEKALIGISQDRKELYTILIRDTSILHSLELKGNANINANPDKLPKLTKTHHKMIATEVYSSIKNYKKPYDKRSQSNSLGTKDKISIADSVYNKTATVDFWQKLTESQMIKSNITTQQVLKLNVDYAFDQMRQEDVSKLRAAISANVRQIAYRHASELWLINNNAELQEKDYELCIHRAIFEDKAIKILEESSSLDIVTIADQPIQNNPYNELLASMVSNLEDIIGNGRQVTKASSRLATVAEKQNFILKVRNLFQTRADQITEVLNNHYLIKQVVNHEKTEQLPSSTLESIKRSLAEQIVDHEMIYGKGNIITERFEIMQQIAKHEANLELSICKEWSKEEAKAQKLQKTQIVTKASSQKQTTSDIDTFIATARHKMRREMDDINAHHHNQVYCNHQNYADQQMNQHHYAQVLDKIAREYCMHINNHITEVKELHKIQALNRREQEAQRRCDRGVEL